MKFASFRKSTSRGFGLLEVILVFALVIGAAAVVFSVFQSAKPSADASNEGSNLSTIATNIKSTYGINHNYTGLDNTSAIAAKIIPSSMASGTSTVTSQWGAVTVAAGTPTTEFTITYAGVPTETCAKFVTGVAGFFPDGITVGGTTVLDTNGKLDPAALATNCNAAAPVDIVFTGR